MGREGDPTPEFRAALFTRITGAHVARLSFRFAVVGITSFALVFGMGTGVYAYASPDVAEGTTLFPLKHGLEVIESQFATTSDERAAFHARMMGRRMAEAENLADKQDRMENILQSAADELDLSVAELKASLKDPAEHEDLIDQLAENNERYAAVLDRVPMSDALTTRKSLPKPDHLRERVQGLRGSTHP